MLGVAFGTDAVTEPGVGVPSHIDLGLLPLVCLVADLLAVRADGKNAIQDAGRVEPDGQQAVDQAEEADPITEIRQSDR
jgi:hypothetical protein